jgi:hypothetical protein
MNKTSRRTLLVLLVLVLTALAVPLAATAGAKGKPAPLDGVTCEASPALGKVFRETDGFTITVGPEGACVDWTTSEAGAWTVVVDEYPARGFVRVGFSVRDSAPGDFCWPAHFLTVRDLRDDQVGNDTLTTNWIPVSVPNACNDGDSVDYTDTGDGNEQLVFSVIPNMQRGRELTITVAPAP